MLYESKESTHARIELIWAFVPEVAAPFEQDKLNFDGSKVGQGLLWRGAQPLDARHNPSGRNWRDRQV
jgi:hypothetical protein